MIAYSATFIVGLVFLVTGVFKALNSRKFIEHIFQYRVVSPQITKPIAITFIGIECALGTALSLHTFPQILIPGTGILLVILSAITFWSTSTGRTQDCGCYGGLALITPIQSILLNLGYIVLMGLAFFYPIPNYKTAAWQWIAPWVLLVLGLVLAQKSEQKPFINFSGLKTGKQWKEKWLNNNPQDLKNGSYFLVFLGIECPYCKQWLPALNIINTQSNLPNVIGVMALNEEEIKEFEAKHLVHFPVVSINKLLFNYLVEGVPTGVLVKDSKIENIYLGQIPQEYSQEVQRFYQGIVKKQKQKKVVRFAG